MNSQLQIYVDRLKAGDSETIEIALDALFMDVKEADLDFSLPVEVKGEAYLAETELVIKLKAVTCATLPCLMCNEPVTCTIQVDDFYHVEPLSAIKGGIFNYGEPLREAILMQTPAFIECHQGKCPQREQMKKYFKKPDESSFPFSGIDK